MRVVLNHCSDSIKQLMDGGLIDKIDTVKLLRVRKRNECIGMKDLLGFWKDGNTMKALLGIALFII